MKRFIQKVNINNGLFLGIVMAIAAFLLHFANDSMYLKSGGGVLFIITVIIFVKASKDFRAFQGGWMTIGESLGAIFITAAVGYLIFGVFEYVLFNFIDPDLAQKTLDMSMEMIEWVADYFSLPDEMLDEMLEQVEDQGYEMSFFQAIMNYISRLTTAAIVGVIISLFTKRVNKSQNNQSV